MADTTSTVVTYLLPTLVHKAVEAFETVDNLRNTVMVYEMENGTLTVPSFGTYTPVAVSEGDMPGAGQNITISSATLTSTKYRVVDVMTDQAVNRALRAGNYDLIENYGRAAGRALAKKVDKLITALYSGFSTGSGSGSSTTMSISYLGLGVANLQNNQAPEPYTCVLNPLSTQYLLFDANYTAPAGTMAPGATPVSVVPTILGVPVISSSACIVSSSAAYGAIYGKEAIALGIENEPHIELERIQDTGYRLTASMEVAVVEVKDAAGYYFHVKAA